ncbi:cupin domain-containing protein [Azotobacter vinelandii]|uniref:cupin domain-containing protein n=1 Tax=Azotobacter vinelandii TaxID=354 RepID=UPI002665D141|nr:cupin domain-containing protein [Azotobacter vinelandii]WKN19767.1 cupin domain-containing protein [Azotobacter vinelandii]
MSGMDLSSIDDLPKDYYGKLVANNTLPLWPSLRAVLPYGKPVRRTQPVIWRYADIRPDLLRAGELTPIEKAERRVLVLCNPGLGLENMQATASIYIGLQLIQPGETAPNHKHSPSAVRFVVEGEGGFTVVNGEKLPMEKGDLILTPPGLWHEHGHEGKGPVVWLDALDLPVIYGIEASYCIEGGSQVIDKAVGHCTARYRQGGLLPYASLDRRTSYPLLRFPWKEVRESLQQLAAVCAKGELVQLAYVNPETGTECLPTLGFSAIMLRPGEEITLPRRSASAVVHVVEGEGHALVDDAQHRFGEADTLAIPTHADFTLSNASNSAPAYLFMVDDAPLHRKLGIYELFS